MEGDWLSKLALKYLGDANRWPEIYKANQAVIEAAAREHPGPPVFGTSDRGHWIFPGTVLTIPGTTCRIAPELPKLPWIRAVDRCGEEVFNAVSWEVFLQNLQKAGLLSQAARRVVSVGKGTITAGRATIDLQVETDHGVVTQTFRAAEMLAAWIALLPGEPGLIAKIGRPALYYAEAGVQVSIAGGAALGAEIRRALGLPPVRQEGTQ